MLCQLIGFVGLPLTSARPAITLSGPGFAHQVVSGRPSPGSGESLEATRRSSVRNVARAVSRWSDEEMRWAKVETDVAGCALRGEAEAV